MLLIDLQDRSDTDLPTITLLVGEGGEATADQKFGGMAVDGIERIYAAVTQENAAANRQAQYVEKRLQDAVHHGRLYFGHDWRITLVRNQA